MISDDHAGSHLFSPLTGLLTQVLAGASLENRGRTRLLELCFVRFCQELPRNIVMLSRCLGFNA